MSVVAVARASIKAATTRLTVAAATSVLVA